MSKLKDASVVVRTAATELQVGHSITHDPGRRALLGRSAAVAALGMAGLEGAAQMRRGHARRRADAQPQRLHRR